MISSPTSEAATHSLPVFLRLHGRPVILVGEGPTANAKRRLLERACATIVAESDDARLAIVVDDDAAVARLRGRGVLVNAVDRPDLCDFTLPAIVDRDPVLVAIGTGGTSAGLAKAVRVRLEALLPPDLGGLATALYKARPVLRQLYPDALQRRTRIDQALVQDAPLDPLRGGTDVDGWLTAQHDDDEVAERRTVIIRLRSDDPDDLTLREARWLSHAERVFHVEHCPPAVLSRARADADRRLLPIPNDPGPGLTVVLH